jgi:hypothetical protein
VSDSKQTLDPNSLAYYAPPGSPDRNDAPDPADRDKPAPQQQRRAEDPAPHLRIVKPNEIRTKDPSDAFAAAVAMAMRDQHESDLLDASSLLHRRASVPPAVKFTVAIAGAALAALAYVVLSSPSQSPTEDRATALLRSFVPAAPHRAPPTLMVRNQSGTVNEPLELGVSVEPAEPGATITIKGLPVGARLTAGEQMSLSEWRMAAEDAANVVVVPPPDFAGAINLSAELRNADGAALVTSVMQLIWKAPVLAAIPANPRAPVAAAAPAAPAPQAAISAPQTAMISPPAAEVAPQTPPHVDTTVRDLSANEVGSLIRRAQEMLAMGDVKGARALLLRATDTQDARAAYSLAKSYDPILSRRSGAPDAGPDLAQARMWYQKAREWGAPEAQRQLDALATYGR